MLIERNKMHNRNATMEILDIRRQGEDSMNLREELVASLTRPASFRSIPSILLWDDRGQELFEDIMNCPQYYPFRAELALLSGYSDQMVTATGQSRLIIELGAGNCKKTLAYLTALEKRRIPTAYFAVDIAPDSLTNSLAQLSENMRGFQYVICHGMLGSYNDCVKLLDNNDAFGAEGVLFLWFGNSITNLPWKTATDLINRLLCTKSRRTKLLLPVDGCRSEELILTAYDLPGGQSRRFMQNGLIHANALLGDEVFDCADWDFEGIWDSVSAMHNSYHVAKRDLTIQVDGQTVSIAKGEKLHGITSGKWDSEIVGLLCKAAGVTVERHWTRSVDNFAEDAIS
ncbi:histidine-specific methyltransferase [Penicillium samsonianum]|uniref:histidine-specific methyltransferase n=1 Tax=Penicillium samsonianum TaxID=1882272 RepID=UPI00254750DE|nr:histidine-specific methyltransferase [Penicillium samsonianum]KAJ6133484.1 histidine-specific methyltransferase [Penicillium samsonianum]